MKNKNVKNKPKKCGRLLFLHSRFSKIFRTPLIKGIHKLNPQNLSSTTTAAKKTKQKKKNKKKKNGKPSPIKTIYKKFICRLYRNWKKGGGRWARSFFVWFVIGLFETLICAIAEDKVCDSCIVSSWALLIFLLCLWWPNSIFFVCCLAHRGPTVGFLLLQCSSGVVRHPRDLQVSIATRFCRVLIFASS